MSKPLKFHPGSYVFACDGTRLLPPRWEPGRPQARRPWWWWLAFGAAPVLLWIVYRAISGWPAGASLLMRLAG